MLSTLLVGVKLYHLASAALHLLSHCLVCMHHSPFLIDTVELISTQLLNAEGDDARSCCPEVTTFPNNNSPRSIGLRATSSRQRLKTPQPVTIMNTVPCPLRTQRLLDVISGRAANMQALGTVFEANTRSAAAQQLLEDYDALDSSDKRIHVFFFPLALSVAETARSLAKAAAALPGHIASSIAAAAAMKQLYGAQTSDVVHFMNALARTPGGTRRLLTLRSDLRAILTEGGRHLRKLRREATQRAASPGISLPEQEQTQELLMHLDDHVKNVISGQILARLSPIGPDNPASVLAFLASAERVHPPSGSADIMRRVGGDPTVYRFCHGLFLPGMSSRPLAFVLSALLPAAPSSIHAVLQGAERDEPGTRNTAVFYSITNCFPGGLQGLGLGSHLLLAALRVLSSQAAAAALRDVVTLSPIPAMAKALRAALRGGHAWALPPTHATAAITAALAADAVELGGQACATALPSLNPPVGTAADHTFASAALGLLGQLDAAADAGDAAAAQALGCLSEATRNMMLFWSARHILFGRPVRSTSGLSKPSRMHRASDPVTNFHASNGASVARLNSNANASTAGLQRAYGCMVNYRYNLLGSGDTSTAQLLQLMLSLPPASVEPPLHGGAGGVQPIEQCASDTDLGGPQWLEWPSVSSVPPPQTPQAAPPSRATRAQEATRSLALAC